MKRIIGLLLILTVIFSCWIASSAEATVTKYKSTESEEFIWEELSQYELSDQIKAGIMGYFYRESQFKSDAIAGWPNRNYAKGVRDICKAFTEKVDSGLNDGSTKECFVEKVHVNYGGYGLGQWSNKRYLENLYDFVQEQGGSIADAELQIEFTVNGIMAKEKLWEQIENEKDPYVVGKLIGFLYDGTRGIGAETIGSYTKLFYGRYHVS